VFPPELQVKQFVGELNGEHGFRWQVYVTGSDRHYLFVCKQNTDISVPVLKSSLQPEVRQALAHGYGHGPALGG
jgi:hypothetical protein